MSETINYSEALHEVREMQATLDTDPNIAAVQDYAAQNATQYSALLQQEEYQKLDASVRDAMGLLVNPFTEAALDVSSTCAELGVDIFKNQRTIDKEYLSYAAKQLTNRGAVADYVRMSKEPLTAENLKDSDTLVLAELAYTPKYSGDAAYKAAARREGITVKEYCQEVLKHWDTAYTDDRMVRDSKPFLEAMAKSERFGNLVIDHNVGNTSDAGEHAVVMVVNIGDGNAVIAVQGTDSTNEDWHNNVEFDGGDFIPEELFVSSVANRYVKDYDSFILTGQSQGGREAVSAAALLNEDYKDRLVRVVNHDGPGYSESFRNKHGDLLKSVSEKQVNYLPKGAYVGPIGSHYGKTYNIKTNKLLVDLNLHHGQSVLIDTNGNFIYTDEAPISYGTITDQLVPIVEVLSVVMPVDRINYYVHGILNECKDETGRLGSPTDDGKKEIEKLLKGAKKEFLDDFNKLQEEQLTDFENQLLIICSSYSENISYIKFSLKIMELGLTSLVEVPYVGVAAAHIAKALSIANKALTVFSVLAKGVQVILPIVAYARAASKKRARESYIASNPVMTVNTVLLRQAAELLMEAASDIAEAVEAVDQMKNHFQNKIRQQIIDDAGLEQYLENWKKVLPIDAAVHMRINGVNGLDGSTQKRLNKAASDIISLADGAQDIIKEADDTVFTVEPGKLSRYAMDGKVLLDIEANKSAEELTAADRSITSVWIGADMESHKAMAEARIEDFGRLITELSNKFTALSEYASLYAKFQETAVETFQNLKL